MSRRKLNYEVNNFNFGHRRRIKVLIDSEWRCTCAWCGLSNGDKHKTSRIKKVGRIKRTKPPWKVVGM